MRPSGRLVTIDMLRGIAVLMVLVSHLPFSASVGAPEPGHSAVQRSVFSQPVVDALGFGRIGVHLFLVISGFCIHMQWARRGEKQGGVSFLAFWKRRLHRLYPPYFITLVLSVLGLYVMHGLIGHAEGGLAAKLGYLSTQQLVIDLVLLVLMAQNLNGASHRIGNGPFWTLALEEQLYMLYFPMLWMRRRWGWARTLVGAAAVTVGWRAIGLAIEEGTTLYNAWYAVGPARWIEWTLGALAVEAYLGIVTLPRWVRSLPLAALVMAGAVVINLPSLRWTDHLGMAILTDLAFGVAFFMVVANVTHVDSRAAQVVKTAAQAVTAVARKPNLLVAALASVGVWSYSLYLTHEVVVVVAKQVGLRAGLSIGPVAALRMVLPLVAAWIFHRIVEVRFMNASRPVKPEAAAPATAAS